VQDALPRIPAALHVRDNVVNGSRIFDRMPNRAQHFPHDIQLGESAALFNPKTVGHVNRNVFS
jgi:hypothetical protein